MLPRIVFSLLLMAVAARSVAISRKPALVDRLMKRRNAPLAGTASNGCPSVVTRLAKHANGIHARFLRVSSQPLDQRDRI
jgi:hypothetical protein